MALTRVIGNNGAITMPTGIHNAAIARFNASFTRPVSNVTRFSDTVEHNKVGLLRVSGTLSGVPIFDTTSCDPGVGDVVAAGSALTLTPATGCSYALTAAFERIDIGSDKNGDATIEYGFVNGDSDTVTETWDETA